MLPKPPQTHAPPLPPLSDSERLMLTRDPRFAARRQVLTIIAGAFFVSVFLYAGLTIMMPGTDQQPEVPLWIVLLFVSAMEIPAQVLIVTLLSRQGPPVASFDEGSQRGSSLFIVAMAFPSAIAIYGFVIHLALGGPAWSPFLFYAIALLWMVWTYRWAGAKATDFMIEGLRREGQ